MKNNDLLIPKGLYVKEEFLFSMADDMKDKAVTGPKKTTITFPANVLKALRSYMMQKELNLHQQSEVVVIALTEFLERNGIKIDPNDGERKKFAIEEVTEVI